MLTPRSLKGGRLADVIKERMLETDALRAKFDRKCSRPDPKLLDRWEVLFGWRPAKELVEWASVGSGYGAVFDDVSDVWMLQSGIDWVPSKLPPLDKMVGDPEGLLRLLTGLELFGHDPSGDRCFVSTLPARGSSAEVHVYNHENGELDGTLYYSIADLIFSCFHVGDEPPPTDRKLMTAFNKDMKAARKTLAKYADPRALFNRVKWMYVLPGGESGYHFAEDMARAPTFADFEQEKARFAEAPWLANYWLLAHYFLGNEAACAETVALAAKAPGAATPALGKLVGGLLASPTKARLGRAKAARLAELCAAVRKNADPSLLEPRARAAAEKARAAGIAKADRSALKTRLAAKEDGWKLIAEFPDDVEAHDLILDALAKRDADIKRTLEQYRRAREAKHLFDDWPSSYSREKVDRRFSRPVAAAFRSGLGFDADNKRAFSPLVHTLAHFDDDLAMDGFAQALERLKMDDERHQYVVQALQASKHPRAVALLNRAAWRFFDFLDETIASQKKTQAEGPTLNNMFRVHSRLLPALISSIQRGDDESEKLVDKVLSITTNMSVLGVAYAAAFRQVGEKKLERHLRISAAYCGLIETYSGEFLPDYAHFNFAEAALAFAKLAPAEAKTMLLRLISKQRELQLQLDVVGGALAALLYLMPGDRKLLAWADRILATRTGDERIYGVLRGIAEGKVRAARDWVRPQVYVRTGLDDGTTLGRTAAAALVALGEPQPPPFDGKDKFATDVGRGKLIAALGQPHRYLPAYVFERMLEEQARGKEFQDAAVHWMRDRLRFSNDPRASSSGDLLRNATQVLLAHGPEALPRFASLFEVEGIDPGERTTLLYCMGLVTDVPALLERLAKLEQKKVLALLTSPTPEVMGALDVVAGVAHARFGDAAQQAIEGALRWRLGLTGGEADHWIENEPTTTRLAVVAARAARGRKLVEQLKRGSTNHHVQSALQRGLDLKTALRGFEGTELSLQMAMRGPDYDGPRYSCLVRHDGKALTLTWVGDNIYFESMLADRRYEHSCRLEAPVALADLGCRALSAIGFAPPEAKKKQKR
jgi:hypothetical protein